MKPKAWTWQSSNFWKIWQSNVKSNIYSMCKLSYFFPFPLFFVPFSFLPCLLSCLSLLLALLPTLILWLLFTFHPVRPLIIHFAFTLALCMPLSLAFPLALLFVLYLTLPCIWHFLQPTLLPPFFSSYRKEDSHGNYHFHGNLIRIFLEKECLKSF